MLRAPTLIALQLQCPHPAGLVCTEGGRRPEQGRGVIFGRREESALAMRAAVPDRRRTDHHRPRRGRTPSSAGGVVPHRPRRPGAGDAVGGPRVVRGPGAGRVPAPAGRHERALARRQQDQSPLPVVLHRRHRGPRDAPRVRRDQGTGLRAELEAVLRLREPPLRPVRHRLGRHRAVRGGAAHRAAVLAAAGWFGATLVPSAEEVG